MGEELILWAKRKMSEAEGEWETDKYFEGYQDAMNDLIRKLNDNED